MKVARIVALVAVAAAIASPAIAQDTHGKAVSTVAKTNPKAAPHRENLKALAKISKDSASKIALAKVAAGSKVKKSSLERANGVVVYSFDIAVPGTTGFEEIHVNAVDGSVVSQMHETPKQERAEMKHEAKTAAKKP